MATQTGPGRPAGQPVRAVQWGDLRRLTPFNRSFGFDRGQPVDRYYIERFLRHSSSDIRGQVLEVGDPGYTRAFGADRVTASVVLDIKPDNPQATVIGDLETGRGIPQGVFDCLIVTQTLHLVYEVRHAVAQMYAALAPGGVLLATAPGISQIVREDMDRRGDYWRFTTRALLELVSEVFPRPGVTVEAHGNLLTSVALLYGLAAEELLEREFAYDDPDYQLLITVRAVKPAA
jgi:hypothetical protein